MSSDGLFGDGLFGDEYYSATIIDAVNVPIPATSSWLMNAATRIRTMTMSILAVSSAVFGFDRIRIWSRDVSGAVSWTGATPGTDPWSPSTPGRGTWTPSSPSPDPWAPSAPGSGTWTRQ